MVGIAMFKLQSRLPHVYKSRLIQAMDIGDYPGLGGCAAGWKDDAAPAYRSTWTPNPKGAVQRFNESAHTLHGYYLHLATHLNV